DRSGIEHAVPDDSETTRTLGHENRAVGEKRHAPRLIESLRRLDADGPDESRLVDHRRIGQRRRRPADWWRRRWRTAATSSRLVCPRLPSWCLLSLLRANRDDTRDGEKRDKRRPMGFVHGDTGYTPFLALTALAMSPGASDTRADLADISVIARRLP